MNRARTISTRRVIACAMAAALWLSGCSSIGMRFLSKSLFSTYTDEKLIEPTPDPVLPNVGLSVTWIGHASVLIQIHDKVIVTDPSFTATVGMLSKRLISPGVDPATIPHVDATLISHLHFDHYAYGSVDALPKNGTLVIPPGGADYTPELGFKETMEAAPWKTIVIDGMKITPVPVKHFGGRYGADMFWAVNGYTGYVIEYQGITVLFCGDTGYDPDFFKEIGKRFTIDLALIPIAPIEPHEFMKTVHTDPAEALDIFADVHARWMVPIHHMTFDQGFDPTPEFASNNLVSIATMRGVRDRVTVLAIGERKIFVQ